MPPKQSPAKKSGDKESWRARPNPVPHAGIFGYLVVEDYPKALAFYKRVFGAKEVLALTFAGHTDHAELEFPGVGHLYVAEASDAWKSYGWKHYGGSPMKPYFFTHDCDGVYNDAIAAGATAGDAPKDWYWGDRSATFVDPVGVKWSVLTRKETVDPAECQRRHAEMMKSMMAAATGAAAGDAAPAKAKQSQVKPAAGKKEAKGAKK